MHEFEYPQKLILTKIEQDESPVVWRQHTHYFKICNEEGEVIDGSDWYQIENGELSLEVRNLSFSTILHSLDRDNEEVDEGRDYEGSQTRETLRGQGRLVRGSTRDQFIRKSETHRGALRRLGHPRGAFGGARGNFWRA